MSAKCRSCPAPVMWATHVETKRANPLEAEPSPEGNCEVRRGLHSTTLDYKLLAGEELEKARRQPLGSLGAMGRAALAPQQRLRGGAHRVRAPPPPLGRRLRGQPQTQQLVEARLSDFDIGGRIPRPFRLP